MNGDLFAAAAMDEAVPLSHWTRPVDAEDDWNPCYGPHTGWTSLAAATMPWERVVVSPSCDNMAAAVDLAQDRTTCLWIIGPDARGPVSACGEPPSYMHGGFQTRDAALSVGRALALEKMAGHAATYADYLRREREQDESQRRARLARITIEDADETGEEGMAERFEDEP